MFVGNESSVYSNMFADKVKQMPRKRTSVQIISISTFVVIEYRNNYPLTILINTIQNRINMKSIVYA